MLESARMSVLSREELRVALAADAPLVEDIDQDLQLQPNGIDIRIDRVASLSSRGQLGVDAREPAERSELATDGDGWWDLATGAYVIGYLERVNLPNDVMAFARPRSSLLRSGVAIHTAVWDAGYSGRGEGLLHVMNPAGYRLQRGARVIQLVFIRLGSPVSVGYGGRYQHEDALRR
jgi:dUTP pyrophosphatase